MFVFVGAGGDVLPLLQKAGIDVVLMDNQRSPRVLAAVDHIILEESLRQVARDNAKRLNEKIDGARSRLEGLLSRLPG